MKKVLNIALTAMLCCAAFAALFTLSACKCEHEWSDWTALTAATCETEGVSVRSCSKCGNTENKKEAELGHEEVTDQAVEATCTAAGKTEGKHCSRCEKVFVQQEEVKALGHDFVDYKYNNDATCLINGTKTAKCSRCNETDTVVAENTAKGHAYGDWTTLVAATCETEGISVRSCSKCGNLDSKQEAALGHKNKNGICLTCGQNIATRGLKYIDGELENTLVLVGIGTATDVNIIIPAVYEGKKVIAIANDCFKGAQIISVDIPDSVMSIGSDAFYGCEKVIQKEKGVYYVADWVIGADSEIVDATIKEGIRGIASYAFFGCRRLISVHIPDGVISIGEYAFV